MNPARIDFLKTLEELEKAASRLVSPAGGQSEQRSADYLMLNGLHVIAFSAIEDFLRRRTIEVFTELTKAPVKFTELPDCLQLHILQEWIKGIENYVKHPDVSTGAPLIKLLYEAEVIGTTAGKAPFVTSDYFFGRSQSNLSSKQISELLSALLLDKGLTSLSEVSTVINMAHLGGPDHIFARLRENRHSAAHSFQLDFKLADFKTDINAGLRVLAFTFDTCVSQAAFSIRNLILKNHAFQTLETSTFNLRAIRYDSLKSEWNVSLNSAQLPPIKNNSLSKKLIDLELRKGVAGETIFIIDALGKLTKWFQPI